MTGAIPDSEKILKSIDLFIFSESKKKHKNVCSKVSKLTK